MGKFATRDNGINKQFKPQIYQSKRRGQGRHLYGKCNFDRRNYQNMYRSNSGDRRTQCSGQNRGRPRYEHNYRNHYYRRGYVRANIRMYQILEDIIVEEDTKEIIGMKLLTEKKGKVGLEKDIWTIIEEETGVVVIVDQEQVQTEIE